MDDISGIVFLCIFGLIIFAVIIMLSRKPIYPLQGYIYPRKKNPHKKPRQESVKPYGTVINSVWSHMSCNHCFQFFAVEDAPKGRRQWTCPWCGVEQEMRE